MIKKAKVVEGDGETNVSDVAVALADVLAARSAPVPTVHGSHAVVIDSVFLWEVLDVQSGIFHLDNGPSENVFLGQDTELKAHNLWNMFLFQRGLKRPGQGRRIHRFCLTN